MQKWSVAGLVLSLVVVFGRADAQIYPTSFRKISNLSGDIPTPINTGASFGIETAVIGDLDDDGIVDLAVGATNQGGTWVGATYILFMRADGRVKSSAIITCTEPASDMDSFGSSTCALGDLDDDGVEDIGVGAGYDSDGGYQTGAFWVLFMKKDGSVKGRQKISRFAGNFTAPLSTGDVFGTGSTAVGDLDGDGNIEIAVGARIPGIVYLLYLNNNGTVKSYKTISSANGLPVDPDGLFGYQLAGLGDVDGDGVPDLAIGGHRSDVTATDSGVIFIVFLTTSGGIKGFTEIAPGAPGLGNFHDASARLFGVGVAGIGDYNGDGVRDMVVGGTDLADATGAIWYLMLNSNGTVKSSYKISSLSNNSDLALHPGDFFGGNISYLGDLNSDGMPDLVIAAFLDDDGTANSGALWLTTGSCSLSADAGIDINVCSSQTVNLNATLVAGNSGTWSTIMGSGHFSNASDPKATVSQLGTGENQFKWTVTRSGCTPSSDVVRIVVDASVKPDAGNDQVLCEGTLALALSGNTPYNRTGQWTLVSGSATILNGGSPNAIITNPGLGINRFAWNFLGSNYCPLMADTVTIAIQSKPTARLSMPDTTYTCESIIDLLADNPNGIGEWTISSGDGEISDKGKNETAISLSEKSEPVQVIWTVRANGCPSAEDTAMIIPLHFSIEKVPNVITPNNDGQNDRWKIPDIDRVSNQIRLYNRWGEEVLNAANYRNDWSGGNLAAGTYFFFINIGGCKTEFKGWLNIVN